ncbi:hemolysin family protein [Sutcliffiella halmapala]|uniref:hemolysin family protein n=1 Tax=Sutcliffiella halmapala TaxID=79882 RepID=UPI000994FB6D|nr:hemolysin family protein [Sutcliffiella halmapala]
MDSIPYDSIILLGALLILMGYFSASEVAIANVNKVRLRNQADNNNAKAKRVLSMAVNFDRSMSTIVIGKNLVKIAVATIATNLAIQMYGSQISTLALTAAIITVLVLVFGELLPKSFAEQYAENYLKFISASLMTVMKIFLPIAWLFVQFKLSIKRLLGVNKKEPTITEEDVKAMVEIGEEEGIFLTQERELLHNAIGFDDIIVKDILTPRPDVVAICNETPIEEIKDIFINEKYSRLPLYEGSIDNIIGVISYRDFFAQYVQNPSFSLKDISRSPFYVIGSAKISNLLKELQSSQNHLAIVLDEYGGTAGIISIEDIIEEIFGEIWDEHDENEDFIEVIDDRKFRMDGRLPVEEFSELLQLKVEESSANTLSGWISNTLGYLPTKGEKVECDHFTIHIEEVKKHRIQKVVVVRNLDIVYSA